MPARIDFAALNLQDALDLAIQIEEEASERYAELAQQLEQHRTHEAAEFFRKMIANENRHAEKLIERRKALFGDAPRTVDPAIIPEVEAPEYDEVRAFMTVHQALRAALASETRARGFYTAALKQVTEEDVRGLLSDLLDEEVLHMQLVQDLLDRQPPEDTTDPNDFVDPPVSQ
jgi:rubrerythrin